MNRFDENKNWRVAEDEYESQTFVDLPYDALVYREKDFSRPDGGGNGFYRRERLRLEKKMEIPRCRRALLDIEGVCGWADVFIDGVCVAAVTHSAPVRLDVTAYAGGTHTVRLDVTAPETAPKYTGLGVSGGIYLLITDSALYVQPDGVTVVTQRDGDRAELAVRVEVINDGDETRTFTLNAQAINMKGRRVAKKARKLKLPAHSEKRFDVPLKMIRHYNWSINDAYMYSMAVSITEGENVLDGESVSFGIRKLELDAQKGLCISEKPIKLRGAVVGLDNGIIGRASLKTAEDRKAAVLKESGFNAVRCVGVPDRSMLDAMDRAGLLCVVELFDVLKQPKAPADGHLFFEMNYHDVICGGVRALRSHPCVAAYGICDCPPESYGRGGYELTAMLADEIRLLDDSRPIVASACELTPTAEELLEGGVRPDKVRAAEMTGGLLALSREKNSFRSLTAPYFDCADIAGYSFLHQRYQSDMLAAPRKILGVASSPERCFDAIDEADKNGVLGDFVSPGIDGLGSGERGDGITGRRCGSGAGIDLTLNRRPASYYREICMGAKNKSYIVVLDPDDEQSGRSVRHSWNWPRFLGQPVTVQVYTSGDVVALYLDGKLVGRKLAGRINKHIATFKINYYPGKLEAVSYHRGMEHSRCELSSVSSPKAIKLFCDKKSVLLGEDNISFVEICVTDKEGRLCAGARRDVEVSVSGDGRLYALTTADPYLPAPVSVSALPVYEGRALAAVRGVRCGKMTLKVTSDGLLSNKITLKVKP